MKNFMTHLRKGRPAAGLYIPPLGLPLKISEN